MRKEIKKLQVLVVDDQVDLLGVLREILINENYEVLACSTGELALERLSQQQFNLLISDIGLPGIDGWQLVDAARQYQTDMSIIMITSWKNDETEMRKKRHGVSAVIHKPFRVIELMEAIHKLYKPKTCCRTCGKIS
ncbi:MAG: response regulator [candidate division Zixibacteria bacterium]|nr:response regulator [candidate division Zixibacteria bacterium]